MLLLSPVVLHFCCCYGQVLLWSSCVSLSHWVQLFFLVCVPVPSAIAVHSYMVLVSSFLSSLHACFVLVVCCCVSNHVHLIGFVSAFPHLGHISSSHGWTAHERGNPPLAFAEVCSGASAVVGDVANHKRQQSARATSHDVCADTGGVHSTHETKGGM